MSTFSQKVDRVTDCHVHMFKLDSAEKMKHILRQMGLARMNLLSIVNPRTGGGNGEALCAKAVGDGAFYCFGGLNHAGCASGGEVSAPPLAEQVDQLLAAGCDGVKVIEGKPSHRKEVPHAIDGEYYAGFFARCEELSVPLLWHVADPEEFWDADLLPDWAARHNWGYDETDVPKEQLYTEVAAVLARHPKLKVIFAHFYFLSADLPRAREFLTANPAVSIDLAPGVEFLFNLAGDPPAGREFFIAHQHQIVFGTDIADSNSLQEATARAGLVRRLLETDDTFTVPAEADELLEPGGDKPIRGLDLPADVLEKVYHANFEALTGAEPKPLDVERAIALCQRDAEIAAAMSGGDPADTAAGKCVRHLGESNT